MAKKSQSVSSSLRFGVLACRNSHSPWNLRCYPTVVNGARVHGRRVGRHVLEFAVLSSD